MSSDYPGNSQSATDPDINDSGEDDLIPQSQGSDDQQSGILVGQDEVYYDGYKIVDLPILTEFKTGEEDQTIIHQFKCKLFRWREDQWKERYIQCYFRTHHVMKFLRHSETGKIRAVMKSPKTYFMRANFYIFKKTEFCQLKKSQTHNNSWVWSAQDCSEGEKKEELYSAEFQSTQEFERFGTEFNNACAENQPLMNN